jgi:hypothetical protein
MKRREQRNSNAFDEDQFDVQ